MILELVIRLYQWHFIEKEVCWIFFSEIKGTLKVQGLSKKLYNFLTTKDIKVIF